MNSLFGQPISEKIQTLKRLGIEKSTSADCIQGDELLGAPGMVLAE